MKNVFLSASVPVPGRGRYFETSNPYLIQAAVRAFVIHVLNTNRKVIWGGHPAITPMIWAVCEYLGANYAERFTLYQSDFFRGKYPSSNDRFSNVIYTAAGVDRESSLKTMRMRMFKENAYEAGVFIGGMDGLIDEYHLFGEFQAPAPRILAPSTGGAARDLFAENLGSYTTRRDINFSSLWENTLPAPVK